ncbi:hypothetical protein F4677DRAFT_17020 [Hypoxylon crocopeplum]|nr:hypothetical protein F4677DRAFT_17020 [Hypoxylon crocopeplum]
MTGIYQEYSAEAEIASFFTKTSTTRSACEARARELVGGSVVPVKVQGCCSYSVYAGAGLEFVVQFRLKSLKLNIETATLANKVYGVLAPSVSFEGQIGQESDGKEPVYTYLMSRVSGMTHLDFILAHGHPENSPEMCAWRSNLLADVARFFALSWKTPQAVTLGYLEDLGRRYTEELRLLLSALPIRFHSIIQKCINSMDAILSLPIVLLHRDFGTCNLMVDKISCHLVGVIDWAEADICPFGLNLHSVQGLMAKLHLRDGWTRYEDYAILEDAFWKTFEQEVGGITEDRLESIKLARITGLLLSRGFTSRLANEPRPVPIGNNERGHYNMMFLDGFLINPATRFEDLK